MKYRIFSWAFAGCNYKLLLLPKTGLGLMLSVHACILDGPARQGLCEVDILRWCGMLSSSESYRTLLTRCEKQWLPYQT